MDSIKEMSDERLQEAYIALDQMIYEISCFGTKDLLRLELMGRELRRRGFEINIGSQITFSKGGDEL